jgi:hypothetical protein
MRLLEKLFIQGLILAIIVIVFQVWLGNARNGFLSYLPPLGFAFYLATEFFVQPLVVGAANIALINGLYGTKGWQVEFWLNGIFIVLAFTTLNLILQTTFDLPLLPYIALIDLLLALPFGCIARFSNGGWKKPID